ncbi:hypothetical protein BD410DRAFT_696624, partial [Rickenella mellea]
ESRRTLADFPSMPLPQINWEEQVENHLIVEHLSYDCVQERNALLARLPHLNQEQASAYQRIIEAVEAQRGSLFFLNGPAGTGKTFVYNTICHKVRSEGWIVLCVASSGIAALLLQGGRTSHSMFKIPVENITDELTCLIPKQSCLAQLIREVRIII